MPIKRRRPEHAFPTALSSADYPQHSGLSKREYFAAAALQGILATDKPHPSGVWTIAREAVEAADALIEALEKER